MIVRDWREADARLLRSCYAREQRSWRLDLGWDTAATWATIEQARTTWGLPGVVALDSHGAVAGWAFAMRDGETLHVGGLVASSPEATAALLDGLLAGVEHDTAACFIRQRAAGLGDALVRCGFDVERFLYLSRPLIPAVGSPFRRPASTPAPGSPSFRAWTASDLESAAALLQASYTAEGGRHFAPGGTIREWSRYLAGLVEQRGCGVFDDALTRVAGDDPLQALALVTSLAPGTAHVAQFVVHPEHRGRGVAAAMLDDVVVSARAAGNEALTLLVGEHNLRARRLYASRGFSECGTFVAARRDLSAAMRPASAGPARLATMYDASLSMS